MARTFPLSLALTALPLMALPLVACEPTDTPPGTDAGTGPTCNLPAAAGCTDPGCQTATGTKTYAHAPVPADAPAIAVTWTTSEVYAAADQRTLYYDLDTTGALTARQPRAIKPPVALDPGLREILESPSHVAAIEFAKRLRAITKKGPVERGPLFGTAVRPVDLTPPGVKKQNQACAPGDLTVCGDAALCVVPEGAAMGTCAGTLELKFYGLGPTAEMVTANVVKVGTKGAIVVDSADAASLSAADATELLRRFDQHIAPRDHQLFGEPKINGKDRDGNGVVMFFVTKRVGRLQPNLVGFFLPDDMRPVADVAHSNAADLLYLEPPGASVSLDALSGTIAHEYQHLINFTAKVLVNGSDQEEVWLDEGLATFAEDITGYGIDAFANVGNYLMAAGSTSLTGSDGNETRGIAHLFVRYLYEQAGGATLEPSGAGTDKGGIAAIKAMVQTDKTGMDALLAGAKGRDLPTLFGDVMTTVAVDGSTKDALTCDPRFRLNGPETDAFTNGQRGFSVRGPVPGRNGPITLMGPSLSALGDESLVPLNGGEIVEIPSSAMVRKFSVGAEVDNQVGLRVLGKP